MNLKTWGGDCGAFYDVFNDMSDPRFIHVAKIASFPINVPPLSPVSGPLSSLSSSSSITL